MRIDFECPHCQKALAFSARAYGEDVVCPSCKKSFVVSAKLLAELPTFEATILAKMFDHMAEQSLIVTNMYYWVRFMGFVTLASIILTCLAIFWAPAHSGK